MRGLRGVLAVALLACAGCSVLSDVTGNRSEVCQEAQTDIDGLETTLKGLSPTDNAVWAQTATDFAAKLDGLSAKADDDGLKKTLKTLADQWRQAGPALSDKGDVGGLTALMHDQPAQLAAACG